MQWIVFGDCMVLYQTPVPRVVFIYGSEKSTVAAMHMTADAVRWCYIDGQVIFMKRVSV
jgi:hypothetical protein